MDTRLNRFVHRCHLILTAEKSNFHEKKRREKWSINIIFRNVWKAPHIVVSRFDKNRSTYTRIFIFLFPFTSFSSLRDFSFQNSFLFFYSKEVDRSNENFRPVSFHSIILCFPIPFLWMQRWMLISLCWAWF